MRTHGHNSGCATQARTQHLLHLVCPHLTNHQLARPAACVVHRSSALQLALQGLWLLSVMPLRLCTLEPPRPQTTARARPFTPAAQDAYVPPVIWLPASDVSIFSCSARPLGGSARVRPLRRAFSPITDHRSPSSTLSPLRDEADLGNKRRLAFGLQFSLTFFEMDAATFRIH